MPVREAPFCTLRGLCGPSQRLRTQLSLDRARHSGPVSALTLSLGVGGAVSPGIVCVLSSGRSVQPQTRQVPSSRAPCSMTWVEAQPTTLYRTSADPLLSQHLSVPIWKRGAWTQQSEFLSTLIFCDSHLPGPVEKQKVRYAHLLGLQ